MEWLNGIRPWIVPVLAIVSFSIAFIPKFNTRFRSWIIGPLETKVDELSVQMSEMRSDMKGMRSDMKEMRSDMKKEHDMLLKAFTDHLIHMHGQQRPD